MSSNSTQNFSNQHEILSYINKQYKKLYPDSHEEFSEYTTLVKNHQTYIIATRTRSRHLQNHPCYRIIGKDDKDVSSSIFILSPQNKENSGTLIKLASHPENNYDVGLHKKHNPADCSFELYNNGVPYGALKVDYYLDVCDLSNVGMLLNKFISKTQTLNVATKKDLTAAQNRYALYAKRIKDALLLVTDSATLDKYQEKPSKKRINPFLGFPHRQNY